MQKAWRVKWHYSNQ